MFSVVTSSPAETEAFASTLAQKMPKGCTVAFFGGLGMGKTAFVRGFAKGLGLNCEVTSPTFALVHDYGGNPPLYHFDMYRVETWDDLYSTGFFDYLENGAYLCIEWSENIEGALPENRFEITVERTEEENQRKITVKGCGEYENFIC